MLAEGLQATSQQARSQNGRVALVSETYLRYYVQIKLWTSKEEVCIVCKPSGAKSTSIQLCRWEHEQLCS